MYRFFKRLLDIILALAAVILLSPLLLVLAILVRVNIGRPVLFRQPRPGYHERIFVMYKFRTMKEEKDSLGRDLPDAQRMTAFGEKLRSSSLDELPELFNILKGDMSIVGPRPLLVKYLPLYSEEQHHRHDVRPGLTGLAQVNGRNSITWRKKFEYDLKYVREMSLPLDFMIVCQTVGKVFSRKDISSRNSVTMEEFDGTN